MADEASLRKEKVPLGVLVAVYASGIFSFTSQHIISLVVPLWVAQQDVSPFMVGLVLGSRHALPIIFAIPAGVLMDRLGPKPVMIFAGASCVLTALLYPLAPWLGAIILLQMVSGYMLNIGWMGSQTLIGQMSRDNPAYAGWFTFSLRIGILAGPFLAGLSWDFFGPWGGFGILSLWGLGFLVSSLMLPEHVAADGAPVQRFRPADLKPKLSDYTNAFRLMAVPAIAFVMLISTFRIAGQAIEGSFYSFFLSSQGYTGTLIGLLYSTSAAMGFVGSAVVGPLARFFKSHWLLLTTSLIATVGIGLTPLFGIYPLLVAAMVVRGFTLGISQPLLISLTAKGAGRGAQGTAVGLRNTLNRMAQLVLPIIMGAIAEVVGLGPSFLVMAGVLAALMLGSAIHAQRRGAFDEKPVDQAGAA
jgi:MFS family permease